jgi:hypothetical protein
MMSTTNRDSLAGYEKWRAEYHECRAGYEAAVYSSRAECETLLRIAAPSWSPDRLAGFLVGYEVARRPSCTCGDCPLHSSRSETADPSAS